MMNFNPPRRFGTFLRLQPWFLAAWSVCLQHSQTSTSAAPPQITRSATLQHNAVDLSNRFTFAVSASGGGLSYQWRLNGNDLVGQTNRSLALLQAQRSDEGNYSVRVSNSEGQTLSEPVRLWVVPSATNFVKGNYTNSARQRLPYFYLLPEKYSPNTKYPLVCWFHGSPGDETSITNAAYGLPGYANIAQTKTLASYQQQQSDPVILLWPTRRAGDSSWTDYVRLVSGFLDSVLGEFNVDTNRVYIYGASEGVHAVWDLVAMRPGLFAAGLAAAGWIGGSPVGSVKTVPFWVWCSVDDSLIGSTRDMVRRLRQVDGDAIYTEFDRGSHAGGIQGGASTPGILNWLLAQRRGVVKSGSPYLLISDSTAHAVQSTSATNVSLRGTANASEDPVLQVIWTNSIIRAGGIAAGSNEWSIASVPLMPNVTNVVVVTGRMTSSSLWLGGSTTFSDTVMYYSGAPVLATRRDGLELILTWIGGSGPYSVEETRDLSQPGWDVLGNDISPPIRVPVDLGTRFFRIRAH